MTLDILICTIDEGILRVPHVLMPPADGISYVVSMQYTSPPKQSLVPPVLNERGDVTLTLLEGRGLSRNRNNAILHSKGDVLLMADDDCRYTPELIAHIFEAYAQHPEADVIHFQAQDLEGHPLHPYPASFVSSVELTFRRTVTTRFDERFGLGSQFCSGEEQVWMKAARQAGHTILYVPQPIVQTPSGTSGSQFLGSPAQQRSKGAMFHVVYGTAGALWRTAKEARWWLVHRRANPLPIVANMIKGILES